MTDLRDTGDDPGSSGDYPHLELCGLYLMGTLDADREQEFERHLASCPDCLDECDRSGPLVTAFGEFTVDDTADLLAEFTAVAAAAEPVSSFEPVPSFEPVLSAEPVLSVAPPEPATAVTEIADTAGSPQKRRPANNRPPQAGPAATRPRTSRRRRVAMASLAVLAAVSFTAAVALYPREQPAPTISARPVSAVAESSGGGVRLSAVVIPVTEERALSLRVEATLDGLDPETTYRLYAVTRGGETLQVTEWTAGSATADVSGEVAGVLDDLAFFSVTRPDGSAVVSARVVRPEPTR